MKAFVEIPTNPTGVWYFVLDRISRVSSVYIRKYGLAFAFFRGQYFSAHYYASVTVGRSYTMRGCLNSIIGAFVRKMIFYMRDVGFFVFLYGQRRGRIGRHDSEKNSGYCLFRRPVVVMYLCTVRIIVFRGDCRWR